MHIPNATAPVCGKRLSTDKRLHIPHSRTTAPDWEASIIVAVVVMYGLYRSMVGVCSFSWGSWEVSFLSFFLVSVVTDSLLDWGCSWVAQVYLPCFGSPCHRLPQGPGVLDSSNRGYAADLHRRAAAVTGLAGDNVLPVY